VVPRSDMAVLEMRTFIAAAGIGTQLLGNPVCNRVSVPYLWYVTGRREGQRKKRNLSDDMKPD